MIVSQLRRWMSRGDRMSPTSTCAGWRKPSGKQGPFSLYLLFQSPSPPEQMQTRGGAAGNSKLKWFCRARHDNTHLYSQCSGGRRIKRFRVSREGGSSVKCLACKREDLSSDPRHTEEASCSSMYLESQSWGGRGGQNYGIYWLASLAN